MIRFQFLTGDVNFTTYGGKWVSNRQHHGDIVFFYVIELINWLEAVGDRDCPKDNNGKFIKYNVGLTIVSPQQVGEKKMQEAYSCCGIEDEMLENAKANGSLDSVQVEALHGYAGGVPVWDSNGNNWRALMTRARQEAHDADFEYFMDRTVNRMGETGRELLHLTDPTTVLQRVVAEREGPSTIEQRILGKIMGVQVE